MEEHSILTGDGWSIALYRYPGKQPILFVHGMGANHYNFDLNERYSLAREASARGYDAWVIELRGRGESRRLDGTQGDWVFEDFLHRDLRPAVLRIREVSGLPLHWVGHSMGGMLGLAYVECYGSEDVKSLSLFGTPLAFERNQWMLKMWGVLSQVHHVVPPFDQQAWGRRLFPWMRRRASALKVFTQYLGNSDNMDLATVEELFVRLVANESPGITLQFADWVRRGEFYSSHDGFNYTKNLGRVRVPTQFFSGPADRMVPAENTSRHKDLLGSSLVRQVVLSVKNGFSADYGHADLVLGKNSPTEVYPLLFRWLQQTP